MPSGLPNFTPRAQQALALARKEADRFNHNFVGTEHLLLGMLKLGQGATANLLGKMGLDLDTVRKEVERQVGSGPEQSITGDIPYTPRFKKALAFAGGEAVAMKHTFVGTEHLLLGLLHEGDGIVVRIFEALNVNVEQVRAEILKKLNSDSPKSGAIVAEAKPGIVEMKCNFTPRAQQVLALSRQEAALLKHDSVGTEHLLLGLIRLGSGVAVKALKKLGLELESVRGWVEKEVGAGQTAEAGVLPAGTACYTPRVRQLLALAGKEARALNHTYVGTEHILLGLLRQGDGVAAKIFKHFGVDAEKTREAILKELDPIFGQS